MTIASISVGGYVMATGGCLSFLGELAVSAVDICFVVDSTDGLSGLVQPCIARQDGQPEEGVLFQDCPDQQP